MSSDRTTTIAALATAAAPAGIAVIRVSGPDTRRALKALFRSTRSPVDEPRKLLYGRLVDFETENVIDHALAVYMPNPYSFTGEDVCEFQFHGSPLIVQRMLKSLFAFGIAPAEPGEFTQRSFINGKLDLVQAEAICDLIEASSEKALRIASDDLAGKLSGAIESVGEPLRDTLAELEASIDFPEEDIEPDSLRTIGEQIATARIEIARLIESFQYGATVKEGFHVLLCGPPNAGKSSLLNLLLKKNRALVSEVAGTTRDLIEESASMGGFQFVFCDSAGITETEDRVEKMGIELARDRLAWADLVLLVVDASVPGEDWREVLQQIKSESKQIWLVVNKIDLNPEAIGALYCEPDSCTQNFYLSVKTSDGLAALTEALISEVSSQITDPGAVSGIVTSERHRSCLLKADEALAHAGKAIENRMPAEIVSAEISLSLRALEEIVGKTHTEDLLGRIFSKFCIGK